MLPLRLLFKNIQIIIYGTMIIILINTISVHLELCVRQWASNRFYLFIYLFMAVSYCLHLQIVLKSGSFNPWNHSGPVQACIGIALPSRGSLDSQTQHVKQWINCILPLHYIVLECPKYIKKNNILQDLWDWKFAYCRNVGYEFCLAHLVLAII